MIDLVVLKRFEEPDEVREMSKGRFEIVHIGGIDDRQSNLRARMEVVGRRRGLGRRGAL
jgi:hypothetical protein